MRSTFLTLAVAGLFLSGAALACDDGVKGDAQMETKAMQVAALAHTSARMASTSHRQDKVNAPDTSAQEQPDPHLIPYVNGGWYESQ